MVKINKKFGFREKMRPKAESFQPQKFLQQRIEKSLGKKDTKKQQENLNFFSKIENHKKTTK